MSKQRPRWRASGVLVALVITVPGCGSLIPVSGTVTLDGQPLAGAYVMFVPVEGGRPVTGRTDAEGRYQLSTMADNDGAKMGEYYVCIALYEAAGGRADPESGSNGQLAGQEQGGQRFRSVIPLKYTRPETSGLTAHVSRGQNVLDFALTSR